MFSAYDLKKIIPRAIFALVAVNLSWGLMDIMIQAVATIGDGAQALVMEPFKGSTGVTLGAGSELAFANIILLAGGAALVGIIPVVGVAVSALFGILFAFGIILLRKVLLVGLVIIAPVAIALSVFPQTESYAKKWWEWFSKLLLMYPFIMAFFGISEVAAGIISRIPGNGFEKLIYQLGAVALLVIPYFLVGKALSLAGGAIGKVAGMVNNKDKGLIDKTKKWEAGKVAERRSDAKAGGRYKDNNFTRPINRTLRRVMNPKETLNFSESGRRAAALSAQRAAMANLLEQRPGAKDLSDDEAELLATGSEAKARDRIKVKVAEAVANGEDGAAVQSKLDLAMATAKDKAGSFDSVSAQLALPQAVKSGRIKSHEIEKVAADIANGVAGGGTQQQTIKDQIIAQSMEGYKESNQLMHSQVATQKGPAGQTRANGAISDVIDAKDPVRRSSAMASLSVQDRTVLHTTVNGTFDEGKVSTEKLGGMDENSRGTVVASKRAQTQAVISSVASGATTSDQGAEELAKHRAHALILAQASTDAKNTVAAQEADALVRDIDTAIEAHNNAGGTTIDLGVVQNGAAREFGARMGSAGNRPT